MKPDSPLSPREELEMRLTALLLGELSAEEEAAMRRALAEDPALNQLYQQLSKALELLRETAAEPEETAAPAAAKIQLAPEKRARLLQSFKVVPARKTTFAQNPRQRRRQRRDWLAIAAMVIGLNVAGALLLIFHNRKNGRMEMVDAMVDTGTTDQAKGWGRAFGDEKISELRRSSPSDSKRATTEKAPGEGVTQERLYWDGSKSAGRGDGSTPNKPKSQDLYLGAAPVESKELSEQSGVSAVDVVRDLPESGSAGKPDLAKKRELEIADKLARIERLKEPAPASPVPGSTPLSSATSPFRPPVALAAGGEASGKLQTPAQPAPNSAPPNRSVGQAVLAGEGDDREGASVRNRARSDNSKSGQESKPQPAPVVTESKGLEELKVKTDPQLALATEEAGRKSARELQVSPDPTQDFTRQSVVPRRVGDKDNRQQLDAAPSALAPDLPKAGQTFGVNGAQSVLNYNFAPFVPQQAQAGSENSEGFRSWHYGGLGGTAPATNAFFSFEQSTRNNSANPPAIQNESRQSNAGYLDQAAGLAKSPAAKFKIELPNLGEPESLRRLSEAEQPITVARIDPPPAPTQRVDQSSPTEQKAVLSDLNNDRAIALLTPPPPPAPPPDVTTAEQPFSTFSLNVSDVSFKLAAASLEKGALPNPATIRTEEFINAFDYHDPEPAPGAPMAFAWERTRYPFAHNRDLLRFSVKTAATGRAPGRPLNLVLLLDNSGSMERADRVRIIQQCLRVLAGQLQPQDRISVVAFARTARLWVDGLPGDQAGTLPQRVGDLTPQGGTNLEEAMNAAYQTARRHFLAAGINRVVLLTDGAANLGEVNPLSLKKKVEAQRQQGIALDCFGIGWEGYNDDLLETLAHNGDGRYGFVNTPEAAATEFAGQLAGALQVAAADVKVQIEFNPARVISHRQIGYAKHQLKKEQFRDNAVDAAEIGAAESGNALYAAQINPRGEGPIATVRVRYREPATGRYQEHEWTVPYAGAAAALEQASPAMRLAAVASGFSEWLSSSPYAAEITPDRLLQYFAGIPETQSADPRPKLLESMIRQAKSLAGK